MEVYGGCGGKVPCILNLGTLYRRLGGPHSWSDEVTKRKIPAPAGNQTPFIHPIT